MDYDLLLCARAKEGNCWRVCRQRGGGGGGGQGAAEPSILLRLVSSFLIGAAPERRMEWGEGGRVSSKQGRSGQAVAPPQ